MAQKPFIPQALTANRLTDGTVVYLDPTGAWIERVDDAAVAHTAAEAAQLLERGRAAVDRALVVGLELIRVQDDAGATRPVDYREVIRATGPTVEPQRPA